MSEASREGGSVTVDAVEDVGSQITRMMADGGPSLSVIIPAHNESKRIVATLSMLLDEAEPGEMDVVVVCNGCTDSTADEARSVAGVRVLEIEQASKIAALRVGDRSSDVFPRLYLDADTLLATAAARELAMSLAGRSMVAGVRAHMDLTTASAPVRLFMEFRQRLPVMQQGVIGAGVYAMSEEGRSRFGEWPDVSGDDQFVFRLFDESERVVVDSHCSEVEPPANLRVLVRRGVRVRRGNRQLSRGGDDYSSLAAPTAGVRDALKDAVRSPAGWASVVVFSAVTLAIRVLDWLKGRGDW